MSPSAMDAHTDARTHRKDLGLVRSALAGDEAARLEVARRLHGRVAATVRYLCPRRLEAQDLVQCCLVELLRGLEGFRGESRLETWADRVAVRTAMRELRREGRRGDLPPADQVERRPHDQDDPERSLGREELRDHVARLLQRLAPRRRMVMVLRSVYGYTMPEIAALTDTRLHTVQNDFRAARRQLRRLVETDDLLRDWARGRRQ